MIYLVLKALHIVGVVTWFAGLFYVVRLFIYHTEAFDEAEPKRTILTEQYTLMARRLWRAITVPAMVLTTATGTWLAIAYLPFATSYWFHLKLAFLFVLFGYHQQCGGIRQKLAAGQRVMTSRQLRIYNEIATFLLVAIVFAAVTKTIEGSLKGIAGCTLVIVILVLFFRKKMQGRS